MTVVNPMTAPSYLPPPPPPLPPHLKSPGQVNHQPDYSRRDQPVPTGPVQYRAQHQQHQFIPPQPLPMHIPQQPYPPQYHPPQPGMIPYQPYVCKCLWFYYLTYGVICE